MGENERKKKITVLTANYPWIVFNNIWMKTIVTISCIVAIFSIFIFNAFDILNHEHIRSNFKNSSFDPGVDNGVKIKLSNFLQKDDTYPTVPFVACECARPENDLSLEHAKIECAVEDDESAPGAKSFSPKQMDVDGLKTMQGYLSEEEQNEILEELSNYEFSQYIGKTCLEFGQNFSLYIDNPTSEFVPPKIQSLADRLVKDSVLKEEEKSNHILVNRYSPGQGIPSHVDDDWWTDGIVSVTLMAGSAIEFRRQLKNPYYKQYPNLEKKYQGNKILECGTGYFNPGSLFAMHGESRYAYGHEIKRREKDRAVYATKNADGKLEIKSVKNLERKTRISLTFRHIKDEATKRLHKEGITGGAGPWLYRNK